MGDGNEAPGNWWRSVAPLYNFSKEEKNELEIEPGLVIRPLSLEDQGFGGGPQLYRFLSDQMPTVPAEISPQWVLCRRWFQPHSAPSLQTQHLTDTFDRVIGALRLLHDEMIAYPFVMHGEMARGNFSMGSSGWAFPSNLAWQRAIRHEYRLLGSDSEDLKALAAKLKLLLVDRHVQPLALVMGRLNATQYRESDADRIIDAAIALETILLRDSEDELSFKEALRGTLLLGGSAPLRTETFNVLRKAYRRRSKIVHGQDDPQDPDTGEIISVMRRIIRRFVECLVVEDHSALISRLDRDALGGEPETTS